MTINEEDLARVKDLSTLIDLLKPYIAEQNKNKNLESIAGISGGIVISAD